MAGRKPITITKTMVQEVERLASVGLNEKQISESLGIGYATFQRNKANFDEALKRGRNDLRERIAGQLIDKAESGDTTALIFIAKKINLFGNSISDSKNPNTIKEALEQLGEVYTSFASGEITESEADKMATLLERFMRAKELTEIEERLTELENKK